MGFDDVFAVIAERTRRQILENLQDGDKAVGELVVELQVSQPTVSKHLKVLREAGLVTMRAQGQKRFYSLERAPLGRVGSWLSSLGATGAGEGAAADPVAETASRAAAPAAGDEHGRDITTDDDGARERVGIVSGRGTLRDPGTAHDGRTAPDAGSVPVGGIAPDGTAADRTLSGAVLAVSDEQFMPEADRPQPGWTVGRAAGRAADLLAHLRRRRDTSA